MKAIIFDFDGVIANSFDCFYPMIHDAMASIGISISEDEYKNLFLGNVHQGFKDFINNEEKYNKFTEYRSEHYSDYYKPDIFPGTIDFLNKIKSKKLKSAICSSGQRETVLKTLTINKIDNFFDMILATTEYTKENMINTILAELKIKPEEAVMITDTVGDIKIAKKMELKTIAVTWGFNSRETLKTAEPDILVETFQEIDFSPL